MLEVRDGESGGDVVRRWREEMERDDGSKKRRLGGEGEPGGRKTNEEEPTGEIGKTLSSLIKEAKRVWERSNDGMWQLHDELASWPS